MDINREAPVAAAAEIAIEAPVELVWELLTDVAGWPSWRPDIEIARAGGPLGTGSTFSRRTGGLDITSTVEELEPPRRIVWTGAAGGIAAVQAWTFDVLDRGALVRTEESWDGEPVAAAPDTMRAALDRSLRMWLEQLKRTAEARARRPDR